MTKKAEAALTGEQAERLEEGFRLGMSREETLAYAGVESGVFEAVCKQDPAFAARLEQQKGYGAVMARRAILKAIESGNENLSKWYLDRLAGETDRAERGSGPGETPVIRVEFAVPRPQDSSGG